MLADARRALAPPSTRRHSARPPNAMPSVTRHIGLSLGADICWPIAFEDILADSKL